MNAIEDYGLIGDCQTAALVGRDGSIDWLCWPRFDSDACFAALLGNPGHGRWLIAPATDGPVEVSRCYRRDTLVLETTFRTGTGKATLIDFMLPRGRTSAEKPRARRAAAAGSIVLVRDRSMAARRPATMRSQ